MKNKVPAVTVCPQGSRLFLSRCMHAEAAAPNAASNVKVPLIKNREKCTCSRPHPLPPNPPHPEWPLFQVLWPLRLSTTTRLAALPSTRLTRPGTFPPREPSVFTLPALTFTFPPASHLLSISSRRLCVSSFHFLTFLALLTSSYAPPPPPLFPLLFSPTPLIWSRSLSSPRRDPAKHRLP